MYIVEVMPLSKSAPKGTLSYFSKNAPPKGAIVSVPLRNKEVPAIVMHTEDARAEKTRVRSADFQMKKLGNVKGSSFFLPHTIEGVMKASRFHVASPGEIFASITPKIILEKPKGKKILLSDTPYRASQEVLLLQGDDEERLSFYKSIIREEFARGRSVLMLFPEQSEIERMEGVLKKGIEDYVVVLHGGISPKELLSRWEYAVTEPHALLIIATPTFLSLPREDVATIIMEKESARTYKQRSKPYADMRTVAECIARAGNQRLIFGDIFLRTETIHKKDELVYRDLSPLRFRPLSQARSHLIDMRNTEKRGFRIFGDEMIGALEETVRDGGHITLFCARKGLHPVTVCSDCGSAVLCDTCTAPVSLHEVKGVRTFVCHKCGTERPPKDKCVKCNSWRLTPLGIGIEQVEAELRKLYPTLKIFRIDRDSTGTHKKALEVKKEFYKSSSAVLLGTEMALPYIDDTVDYTGVVSVDALFAIPDFRINERVMNILTRLRGRARKGFLIQTRDPEHPLWNFALRGNLLDFYREEIAERKFLLYPPFSTIIKLSIEGTRAAVEKEVARIKEILKDYEPFARGAYTEVIKGKHRMHIILKWKGKWPDETLSSLLVSLPPQWKVAVDPEDIL